MPIVGATVGTLEQAVAELERDGHEIIQLLATGDSVKVLYRKASWQNRDGSLTIPMPPKAQR